MTRSWAEIDLGAIAHNAATLRAAAPGVALCAVVKANGYGHGEVEAAAAAIEGGASILAVARTSEGRRLRAAGFDVPIWVLSEPELQQFSVAAEFDLQPAVYTAAGVKAAAEAAAGGAMLVHLKVDTGMHRVGADPREVVALAEAIAGERSLHLASVWTHCAVADEPDNPFTDIQLDRYEAVLAALAAAGIEVPLTHAANSGAAMAFPRARRDVIRSGIAIYGLPPSPELDGRLDLRPALRWVSSVSFVKRLPAGERVSYGQRAGVEQATTVATIPVGYADGYARALWNRSPHVLVGGRRRRILGVVTMDQLVVDCGDDPVQAGDEVVLIGRQGSEVTTAGDLATALDTINYEIVCGVSPRVERRYVNGGV